MKGFDPLVSNGILYAPVHDIVSSPEPYYFADPTFRQPGMEAPDSFAPKTNKEQSKMTTTSSWKKWLLGAVAIGVTILGIKKFGMKYVRNFLNNHPRIHSVATSVKNCFNRVVNFFKKSPTPAP
ncbi:hypothetical protein IJS77_02980 [bacterium]|nr:hypothetical protein [bacterium]